jgi:hypothetical protein
MIRGMHHYNIHSEFDMVTKVAKEIYFHTVGFIKESDCKLIEEKLRYVSNGLETYSSKTDRLKDYRGMQRQIDELVLLIMKKTKHLLLPYDDADQITEFNEEDFFKQSGLL